jgi:BASS family bile acid:Na+ symporter
LEQPLPETLRALIPSLELLCVILAVAAIGMNMRIGTVAGIVRRPAAALRGLGAMFVVLPLLTLAFTWLLPLDAVVRAALLAMAVAPAAPLVASREKEGGDAFDFVIGVEVASCVAAVLAAPLWLFLITRLFDRAVEIDLRAMVADMVMTIGAPLLTGVLVKHFAPSLAAGLRKPLSLVAMSTLMVLMVVQVAISREVVWQTFGSGAFLAIVLTMVSGLAAGHLLGGPEPSRRRALASATMTRHPGIAILLAGMAEPERLAEVSGAILLILLTGKPIFSLYARRMERVHGTSALEI